MKKNLRLLALLAMALPVFTAGPTDAAQVRGSVSLEDYYSGDSAAGTRHSMSSRLRLDLTKLDSAGKFAFHFDGRQRFDLSGESGTSSKEGRIDQVNLDYTGTSLYLSIGRIWPKDMPIEVIDGINAVYQSPGSKTGVGVFAGLKPNPYSQSTTADYTAAGAYITHAGEKLNGGAAYVYNGFKGDVDRQYLYGYATYTPRPWLFAFGNVTADLSPSGTMSLTNLITELTWRPDDIKSFTVGYNQFRAFKYYASTLFADIDDSRQDAFYLSANYRLAPQYMVYGRVETQKRYFPALVSGQNNMLSYRAGISGDNMFNTGVAVNVSASVTDSFGSQYTAYNIDMSRMLGDSFQVMLNGAYSQSVFGSTSSGSVMNLGGSVFYMARRWNFSLSLDTEHGDDYTNNRLLTRVSFNL
jgi:hypothetical protein